MIKQTLKEAKYIYVRSFGYDSQLRGLHLLKNPCGAIEVWTSAKNHQEPFSLIWRNTHLKFLRVAQKFDFAKFNKTPMI